MTSPFVSSLVKEHGSMNPKQYGENGAVEFSQHGVKGDGSRDVEGYLTAAFSGILRGTSQQSISKYINNIVAISPVHEPSETPIDVKVENRDTYKYKWNSGEYERVPHVEKVKTIVPINNK